MPFLWGGKCIAPIFLSEGSHCPPVPAPLIKLIIFSVQGGAKFSSEGHGGATRPPVPIAGSATASSFYQLGFNYIFSSIKIIIKITTELVCAPLESVPQGRQTLPAMEAQQGQA